MSDNKEPKLIYEVTTPLNDNQVGLQFDNMVECMYFEDWWNATGRQMFEIWCGLEKESRNGY